MSKMFLVTGSTGLTGSKTVKFLVEAGARVRAFVHNEDERSAALAAQGAEIMRGDLLDFEAVRSALEGTQGAYFVYPIRSGILQASAYFAQAAKEAGIQIVVNMSQISARREAKSHAAQDHWISEQVFNWSGVPTTHLRPTLFAEWALYWIDQIKTGILRLPFGTGKHAPIAGEDQARVIAKILLTPQEHKGQVYRLYGEKEYSFPEIAAEIGKVIGKPLGYEQVDAWTLKKLNANIPRRDYQGREQVVTDTLWQHFEEIAKDHQNGVFAGTNDLVEKIGGQRPIGLPEYLEAHRSAFLS
ncbi:NmrA family NAD(P)-binding protein [Alloacidobacterium dinghuense]|uniref:NmrA family NAD(P)-binding protein n=1 Tax=Alloacidobacterium dinghuense TaxID=2763107 RepID=A0A7G8BJM5_9BACT|nr:NmrA family NAD(P)-binding protein [Alloacidobacterium dinghuense]QNI32745.1 NmrA family NAD(P)-binding protein [Alloacidobacterium dinghuense]